MDYINSLFSVEDPYYSSDEEGAAVEFLVVADDDTYKNFAERTPMFEESGYDSFEDLTASDDYLNIYVNVRENDTVEAVIGISGGGELYPVALSNEEQEALHTFISRYCDEYMDKSLAEMLEEAKEGKSPISEALEDIYGKEFTEAIAQKPAGFGNHGELYEDSSREQRTRDMDRDER